MKTKGDKMKFGQKNKEQSTVVDLSDSNVQLDLEVTEPLVDLNSTAFSMTRHPEGGFALVTVKYNPVTMQAQVQEVKRVSDNREEAEYHFRVKVGEYFASQELNN